MINSSEQADLQKRLRELAMLNEIGRALSATIKTNDLMKVIYQQTTRVMEVSAFYIALYIKEKNSLQFIFDVLKGKRQPFEERLRPFGNGRTEYIIRTKKPLLIKSDPQKIYRKLGIVSADQKAKATAGVPMIYGGKAIGALVVQSYDLSEAYDENHIELLSTIASQAAIAIANAQMFETLEQQRERLAQAKSLTDNILNNVKDGLFLLNRKLQIESQYSAALKEILGEKEIAGKKLSSLLKNKIDADVVKSMDDYLSLILDEKYDEQTLSELNPLLKVKTVFQDKNKVVQEKYLTFHFKRVFQNGTLEYIIVTVNDISRQTILAKQLEESKAEKKKQTEMLFTMLNVDSQMLEEFMNSTYEELENIRSLLLVRADETLLEKIYRAVHTIKGNASMLQLDFMAKLAHKYEEKLTEQTQKGVMEEEDYQELLTGSKELIHIYSQMERLIARIKRFQTNYRPTRKHESDMLFKSLETLSRSIASKSNKKVILVHDGYKPEIIPNKHRLLLRDILVQLTRNAIRHGIESTDEREKLNKAQQGRIVISNYLKNGKLHIIFRDDGRGLQLDKIKEAALKSGKYTAAQLEKMHRSQLMQLILESGVTTVVEGDITAGRGVGMDIIREKVLKMNGQIKISSEKNEYTQFEIIFSV